VKLLVMDSMPAAADVIANDLGRALNLQVFHASCQNEAMRRIEVERDTVGVLVFFLETHPERGLSFIRDVKELCEALAIRSPDFIVLTPGDLDAGYLKRFRMVGAECRVYGFPRELSATVRRMIHERSCENGKPTIVVERGVPRTRFHLLGPAGRELLSYGHRLLPMMNAFAINFGVELSTNELAEAADILSGSVKVYLMRLRAGYDEAREKVGVKIPGNVVFCTMRKDGGFVHVLRARVVFV
jgi:hypothetical protein